jgi:hypothetical protein
LGKEKYLNEKNESIRLNNKTKFTDLLSPISFEIQKEEAIKVQIPKVSKILKTGIEMGLNKIQKHRSVS